MDYLHGIVNTNAQLQNFEKGLIALKTDLSLGVANVTVKETHRGDIQQSRPDEITRANAVGIGGFGPSTLDQIVGDRFQFRRQSKCLTTGTVYGAPQDVVLSSHQHSYFGLNKLYITSEGLPNEQAIIRRLKELGVSSDVKEARYGRLYNAVFATDYYDNSVALLYRMYSHLMLLRIKERMHTSSATIVVTALQAEAMRAAPSDEAAYEILAEALKTGSYAIGHSNSNEALTGLMQQVNVWYDSLPPKKLTEGDQVRDNPEYLNAQFTKQVATWDMYTYDDGHSKSGKSYGNVFDFIDGKYMIPDHLGYVGQQTPRKLSHFPTLALSTDEFVDSLETAAGYVNLSGFSTKEAAIFNSLLSDNVRSTPFLIDQDIRLAIPNRKIYVHQGPRDLYWQGNYTANDVQVVLMKYVMNHRLHEDYHSAVVAAKYWLCQPANETVESHWWSHVKRQLHLPKVGMKRAAFHFMLEGEGVATSSDALSRVSNMFKGNDSYIIESLMANTAWQWGEYMFCHNAQTTEDILSRIGGSLEYSLVPEHRADQMYSAVIGRAVPKPVYNTVFTCIVGSLMDYKTIRPKFGKISIDHIRDYGYTVHPDGSITLNSMVGPSGVALITGLAGTLLQGTPYGSVFTSNPAVSQYYNGLYRLSYNYNDLWIMGVVNRWQGYTVNYTHPLRNGMHKIFAANNVTIAMPPVTPATLPMPVSYQMHLVEERGNVFGSSFERTSSSQVTFYWSRRESVAQTSPSWNAMPCQRHEGTGSVLRGFISVPLEGDRYTVSVMTRYDIHKADFHREELVAGVPLPQAPDPSRSLEPDTTTRTEDVVLPEAEVG